MKGKVPIIALTVGKDLPANLGCTDIVNCTQGLESASANTVARNLRYWRIFNFYLIHVLTCRVFAEKRQLQRASSDSQWPPSQVSSLPEGVCPAVQSCPAHQNPHRRETLPMHLLRKEVFGQRCLQLSHQSSHQGGDVQLPVLWPNLFQKAG